MGKYDAKFQLKAPTSKSKSVIRLRMAFDYKDFTWELNDSLNRKLRIYPSLWDKTKQYPISKSKIPSKYQEETYNLQVIGERIDRVRVVVNQIVNEAALNDIKITNEYLKSELLIRLGLEKKAREITICDFCYHIIDEMEKGIFLIEKTKKRYEQDSIQQYKVFATLLEAKYPNLVFSEIDKEWFDDFNIFLLHEQNFNYKSKDDKDKRYSKKALASGSIANYIKRLTSIMRFGYDRGISSNTCYNESWFTKPTITTSGKTKVYLSEKEIKLIYNFETKEIKDKNNKHISADTLLKAKDLFLIGCYSGLRVSDYNNNLAKHNFTTSDMGNKVLTIQTKKTGEKAHIPIFWEELITIAEKYNYNFPKMSDQKINDYIKLVCQQIGEFDNIIEYTDIVGGVKKTFKHEKWQLITTHTGRRSASTNLAIRGLSSEEIAKFTAHKSNSMAAGYNKTSSKQTADILMSKLKNTQINTNK